MRMRLSSLLFSSVLVVAACDGGSLTAPPGEALLSQSGSLPTVSTDKSDYAPGEVVTISGSGWTGDHAVRLVLVEDPDVHGPRAWDVSVDENGSFVDRSFTPEPHHLGVGFTLTATGLGTGRVATTSFTDGTVGTVTIAVQEESCTTPTSTFLQGETVCATFAVDVAEDDLETNVRVEWLRPGNVVVTSATTTQGFPEGAGGLQTFTRSLVLASSAPTGTWTVRLCQGLSPCTTTNTKASETFMVTAPGPATQSITFPYPGDKTYGDDAFQLAATATSGLAVQYSSDSPAVCSVSGDMVTLLAAGTCTLRASQPGDGMNWAPADDVSHDVPVAPRPLPVTADAKHKVAGEADPPLTYQVAPGALIGTDALSGELTRDPGEDPGVYQIRQGTLTAGPNYEIQFTEATLTIEAPSETWTMSGFHAPVSAEVTNSAKAGSTIPLRFNVYVDGVEKKTTDGIVFEAFRTACDTQEVVAPIELEGPGATSLKYSGGRGGGHFQLNWKTPAQEGCYTVTVSAGASSISAAFELK